MVEVETLRFHTRLWEVGGEGRAQLREGQPLEEGHAFKDSRARCSVCSFSQDRDTAFRALLLRSSCRGFSQRGCLA